MPDKWDQFVVQESGPAKESALSLGNLTGLKDPSTGKFRQFSSPEDSLKASAIDIGKKASGKTTTGLNAASPLSSFVNVWQTGNLKGTTTGYSADDVAKDLGITASTPIGGINPDRLARSLAKFETGYGGQTKKAATDKWSQYEVADTVDTPSTQAQPEHPSYWQELWKQYGVEGLIRGLREHPAETVATVIGGALAPLSYSPERLQSIKDDLTRSPESRAAAITLAVTGVLPEAVRVLPVGRAVGAAKGAAINLAKSPLVNPDVVGVISPRLAHGLRVARRVANAAGKTTGKAEPTPIPPGPETLQGSTALPAQYTRPAAPGKSVTPASTFQTGGGTLAPTRPKPFTPTPPEGRTPVSSLTPDSLYHATRNTGHAVQILESGSIRPSGGSGSTGVNFVSTTTRPLKNYSKAPVFFEVDPTKVSTEPFDFFAGRPQTVGGKVVPGTGEGSADPRFEFEHRSIGPIPTSAVRAVHINPDLPVEDATAIRAAAKRAGIPTKTGGVFESGGSPYGFSHPKETFADLRKQLFVNSRKAHPGKSGDAALRARFEELHGGRGISEASYDELLKFNEYLAKNKGKLPTAEEY